MRTVYFDQGFFNQWSSDLTTADICLIPPGTVSKTLGLICLPTVYALTQAQQRLIKGESNLSSSIGEEHFGAPSIRSPACAVIITGDSWV